MSFLTEFRRRKIFQVAAVYGVVTWLLVQIVVAIEAPLNLPPWTDTLVIVMLAIGFPVTMIMSWAFNVTREGVVRDLGQGSAPSHGSQGKAIDYVLTGSLALAVVWLLYRDIMPDTPPTPAASEAGLQVAETLPVSDVLPNSIAVLPFANFSPDPNNAFFAAGIHDTILHELAKISDMHVISLIASG